MPWKNFSDPYHIWIAEIILQQTRVDQGSPYFEKFIHRFPDLQTLATASVEDVLLIWEGLGYYSRARNLHHTARFVWEELEGKFPGTARDLQKLKGVGPYTAAAIASFAYGEAIGVVDGNVKRVISRYFHVTEAIDRPEVKNHIQALVNRIVEQVPAADFNQAIMNFGAMLCIPRGPDCSICPLRDGCQAFQLQEVDHLPVKSKSTVKQNMWMHFGVYIQDGRIALIRNTQSNIWKNLYLFPVLGTHPDHSWGVDKAGKIPLSQYALCGEMDWILTHRRIKIYFYELDKWPESGQKDQYSMVELEKLNKFALPRPLRLFLKQNSIKLGINTTNDQ